ncbi:M81 family metallopeptidase [Bacteroides sp. GD17]|jgi:microcystin degradation protein MlrC|uniref:M81 family metallopeptidase n=1 Tax=Bacteroides sp. GD17 TaxID=3139826 RepID=UPI0025F410CE|nr:M81 family metallopeptidase [uncultured Bacteroides sp.]
MKKLIFLLLAGLIIASCNTRLDEKKLRILTCGIRHESNTFSTLVTDIDVFNVLRGEEILQDTHLWSEYLKAENVEIIPTLHAYAWPGGVVSKEAYETFKSEILEGIRKAGDLDGVYMDMHGALHVDGYEDAQADLIKAIRKIVGSEVVISGSFDLHGNLSDEFVKELNLVTGFRTAPHRDGEETKLRAVKNLVRVLRQHEHPRIIHVDIPILVPGEKSITEVEPLHSIYARLDTLEKQKGILDASIFVGYAWADLPRSAMRVFVVAQDSVYLDKAKHEAYSLAQNIWDVRHRLELDVEAGNIDEMIKRAYQLPQKTVFISDSGDNTTAGAPGDNPQVIRALLKNNAHDALVAGLVDEEAYQKCIEAGVGNTIRLTMGGKKDTVFGSPLTLDITVDALSPDSLLSTSHGVALVHSEGVKIAIINSRRSFVSLKDFEEIGLNPLDFKIVVVKLGYLYPELRDIAPAHLMALTSGFCNLDMPSLPFTKVRRPAYPLDLEMEWKAGI